MCVEMKENRSDHRPGPVGVVVHVSQSLRYARSRLEIRSEDENKLE